jgi:hypothetical protein
VWDATTRTNTGFASLPEKSGVPAWNPLCLKAHFCQAEIYNLRGHVSKNGKADSILTKLSLSEGDSTKYQKSTARSFLTLESPQKTENKAR